MRRSVRRLSVLATVALLLGAPLAAQQDPGEDTEADQDSTTNPFEKFEKLVEDAELREGFFDTYEKDGHLYLAIPQNRLGEEFLLNYQIARGVGSSRLFGGTMLNIFEGAVVAFEQHDDRVYLVQRPHRFMADEGTPQERAVALTYGSSVLQSTKVEAQRPDSAVVIDIFDWLLSDMSGISSRLRSAVSTERGKPGSVSFDKDRSYLESVKAFPHNVNFRAMLTFKPGKPTSVRGVPDSRYIPISIHYAFVRLPETPMEPRLADDRLGFFMTVRKDFTNADSTFFVRYVNRWRLERGRRRGNLWEPRQPIVYYIDRTVPDEIREAMKEGVEAWNKAFEAAGWYRAIRVDDLPEGADPADIRYHTLRWNVSDRPGYGAIGPSVVDPRTGEILDADILFEANMIRGWKNFWRTNISPVTAIEEMFQATEAELAVAAQGGEMASFGAELSSQGSLLRAALIARGEIGPNEPVPGDYIRQAMRWVTMHEVGHTLGLRHNFRGSEDTPYERLHDRRFAEENGVFNSAMEYPAINIAPAGQQQGYFYNPRIGSYDRWVISYGYTNDAGRAAAIARQAAQDGHAYGTDEDARGAGAIDPHINVYDLSDDPIAWGRQRAELVRGIWNDLPNHVLSDNGRYATLTQAFGTLLNQYARAIAASIKHIGGQYQYRDHVGDPGARPPFVAVPKARQQEALDFITEYAFSETAFAVPPEVLRQFGADRWSHWGNQNTINGRIDYPLQTLVVRIQTTLLNRLTNPYVFQRILDAELKFGPDQVLSIPEMLEQLTRAVWSELIDGSGNVPQLRRGLQRAYIERLTGLVTEPPETLPADARSVARMQLAYLGERLDQALSSAGLDAYTRAHLADSKAAIDEALEVK